MKPCIFRRLWPALSLLLVSACAPPPQVSLEAWLQAERQAAFPPLRPLPEPAPLTPPAYAVTGLPEPFSSDRGNGAAPRAPTVPQQEWTLASLDPKRPRPPLEAFPLDSMTLVGTLSSGTQRVALVKLNQQIHPVRIGDHLGPHQARVRRITEQGMDVSQRVQDANGAWTERLVSIPIREEPKP
jgi:type IV pilus assembly protein PilP